MIVYNCTHKRKQAYIELLFGGLNMENIMSKKLISKILVFIFLFPVTLFAQPNSPQIPISADTWVATDALGRVIPGYKEVGPPRVDKYIGVFYFLWHGTHSATDIYDITRLLQENPDDPAYGPRWMFHWWDEPEAGYYRAGRDRNAARATLGFGGISTQFPSRPQSDSHNSRFRKPPYDPARSDFPSYGSDLGMSSHCLSIIDEA